MMQLRLRAVLVLPFFSLAFLVLGCGDNTAPLLDPIGDRQAYANTELALVLHATDEDDDELTFSFASELPNITARTSLDGLGDGRAMFRWTPLAADIGMPAFDFSVTDGEATTRETIVITVNPPGGESMAPVFVQPLGTGTTLDVQSQSCVDVPIVVEDPDTAGVTLGQIEPVIEGAQLSQDGELSGNWSFCPTPAQIEADDRYTLTLSADDGDNPPTLKDYLIVLRSESKTDCPGQAPVVDHTPEDVSSLNDLTITAHVSDDQGIKYEPLFYYSLSAPGEPPNVTQMTQLTMLLLDGDMQNGDWGADVPNPVVNTSPGSTAQLYYVIVVQDNDDAEGSCDHLTQAPASGSYTVTVTNPGGSGGLGLCDSCTADVQCGGSGDLCVFLDGGYHCFQGCQGNNDCPTGYYCSFAEFTSVDNVSARQCIPNDYQCDGGTGPPTCTDDSFEENDSLTQASSNTVLPPGTYNNLKSCPAGSGDDEDWYRIDVSSEAQVNLSISGGSATDLDLALYDTNGTLIDKSDSLTSNEALSACLTSGYYYVRIYAYGSAENSYSLTYSQTATSCSSSCQDDGDENDDNASQARYVNLNNSPYTSTTNAICAWDDDWFEVYLFGGETLYATLTFSQSNSSEDLDLYFFQGSTDLTGCDEQNPGGCDYQNGQSGTSNETLTWPIAQTDTYYVVVHGWAGSENLYDICIGLAPTECP